MQAYAACVNDDGISLEYNIWLQIVKSIQIDIAVICTGHFSMFGYTVHR